MVLFAIQDTFSVKKLSEYAQEIPELHAEDQPTIVKRHCEEVTEPGHFLPFSRSRISAPFPI